MFHVYRWKNIFKLPSVLWYWTEKCAAVRKESVRSEKKSGSVGPGEDDFRRTKYDGAHGIQDTHSYPVFDTVSEGAGMFYCLESCRRHILLNCDRCRKCFFFQITRKKNWCLNLDYSIKERWEWGGEVGSKKQIGLSGCKYLFFSHKNDLFPDVKVSFFVSSINLFP